MRSRCLRDARDCYILATEGDDDSDTSNFVSTGVFRSLRRRDDGEVDTLTLKFFEGEHLRGSPSRLYMLVWTPPPYGLIQGCLSV